MDGCTGERRDGGEIEEMVGRWMDGWVEERREGGRVERWMDEMREELPSELRERKGTTLSASALITTYQECPCPATLTAQTWAVYVFTHGTFQSYSTV